MKNNLDGPGTKECALYQEHYMIDDRSISQDLMNLRADRIGRQSDLKDLDDLLYVTLYVYDDGNTKNIRC